MPYKSMEDVPANIKKLNGVPLTLAQANKIAEVADAITDVDNPWAVAIAQFKKGHRVKGAHWEKREKSLDSLFSAIRLLHLAGRHDQKRHAWRYGGGAKGVKQSLQGRNRAEREVYKKRARERGMGAGVEQSSKRVERARARVDKEKAALFKEEKRLRRIYQGAEKRQEALNAAFKKREELWKKSEAAQDAFQKIADEMKTYEWHKIPPRLQARYNKAMDLRNKTYEKAVAHNDVITKVNKEATTYAEKNGIPLTQYGAVDFYKIPIQIDEGRKAFNERTKGSREILYADNLSKAAEARKQIAGLPDKRIKERNKLLEEEDDLDEEKAKIKKYVEITYDKDADGRIVGIAPGWEDLNLEYTSKLIEVDQRLMEINGRLRELRQPSPEERALVSVPNPANPNYIKNTEYASYFQKGDMEKGHAATNALVGTGMLDGVTIKENIISKAEGYKAGETSQRAHHFGYQAGVDSETNYGDHDSPWIVVHENGHAVETHDPYVRTKANEFLNRRTIGEVARPLKEITGNKAYEDHEIAKPDKFTDAYVGKIYNGGHTEVISMGLQYMYENPTKFAKNDPDYFDFIYALMRT